MSFTYSVDASVRVVTRVCGVVMETTKSDWVGEFDYSDCREAMSEIRDHVIDDIEQEIQRIEAERLDADNEVDDTPLGYEACFHWDREGYARAAKDVEDWEYNFQVRRQQQQLVIRTPTESEAEQSDSGCSIEEPGWSLADEIVDNESSTSEEEQEERFDFLGIKFTKQELYDRMWNRKCSTCDEDDSEDEERVQELMNYSWEAVPSDEECVTQGDESQRLFFEHYPDCLDWMHDMEAACEDYCFNYEMKHDCDPPIWSERMDNVVRQAKKCKTMQKSANVIEKWMIDNELFEHVKIQPEELEAHHYKAMFYEWSPGSTTFWCSNRWRAHKDVWLLAHIVEYFNGPQTQGVQNDLEESESLSKFENVTFVDERPVEATPAHINGDKHSADQHVEISEIPWSVKQVLEREQYIGSFTWKVGDVGNLVNIGMPKALVKDGSVVQQQLRLCGFLRAGVEIRIVMNGNKFMIGRLIAHVEPVRFKNDDGLYQIQMYPNFPHVMLDASVSNSAVLCLPFCSILSYFCQRQGALEDDSINTIGRLYIDVFNKLQAPEGGTQQITITVYARFLNPAIHQTVFSIDKFSYSDGFVTQGLEDGNLVVNRSNQPPCFGDVKDNTVMLSLNRNGGKTADSQTLQGIDDDLKKAIQIPSLAFQGFWKTSDVTGNTLYSFPVSPSYVGPINVSIVKDHGVVLRPSFLNYISRCFAYWTGDIMIKIQVVGNAFASGRLVHIFDPSWVPSYGAVQDLDTLMNYNCVIQDIQEQQEIVIQVPYTSVRPFLRCDHWQYQELFDDIKDTAKLSESFMGYFRTLVLNQLVMPAQMTQTIEVNYFIYAGPNFSFRVPVDLQPLDVDTGVTSNRLRREPVYPWITGASVDPEYENKDYIRLIWSEGLRLFKQGWLTNVAQWWKSLPVTGKGELDEVYAWCYKARQLIEYAEDTEESPQKILMKSLGRFQVPITMAVIPEDDCETQGLEEFVTGRVAPELTPIVITKGNRANNPPEIEDNALSTFLHRYYPLMIGSPHLGLTGFTMYQIPVNPCFVPQQREPIKGMLPPVAQTNQLAWISKMFGFWSGSLRYKIVFPNTDSDVYVAYVPQENMYFRIHSGVSVQDVHALMAYAGDVAVTHLQGSIEVTVPFSSPYNQCMTSIRGGHYDARNQNGTLFIYVRNKLQSVQPFIPALSVFISAGSDFKLNWMLSPPNVYDGNIDFDCNETKFEYLQSESHKKMTNYGMNVRTPSNAGWDNVNKITVMGFCEGEPTTQGLGDYLTMPFTFMKNVNKAAISLPAQVEQFNKSVEEAKDAIESASKATSEFSDKAKNYLELAASTLLAGNVVRSFVKVCKEATAGNFVDLALSVASLLGFNIRRQIIETINALLNYFSKEKEQAQAQAMNGAILNVVEDNEGLITKSVAVLGTVIYAYVFDCLPDFGKLKEWLKNFLVAEPVAQGFDLRGAHFGFLGMNALAKVFDNLVHYAKKFVDWVLERDSPETLLARKAEKIRDKVLHLIGRLDALDNEMEIVRALQDPLCHNRFYQLMEDCMELTETYLKEGMDVRVGQLLTECRTRARKLLTRLERENPTHGWRYDPFVVCLHGETGTGKTALMREVSDVIGHKLQVSKYNRVFNKTINDDFWSGYNGQPIVHWDEFGQNAQKDATVAEFIELRGNDPHKLNMAALEEKGKYFTSQAIIMTTNVPYHTFGTVIRDKDAYLRRRHLMIQMKHKPGFNANVLQGQEGFDKTFNHCEFYFTGNMDRQDSDGPYTKEEVMERIDEEIEIWDIKQRVMYEEYISSRGLGHLPRGVILELEGVNLEEENETIVLPEATEPLAPPVEITGSNGVTYRVAAIEKQNPQNMCMVMGDDNLLCAKLNSLEKKNIEREKAYYKMTYNLSNCSAEDLSQCYIDKAAFCYVPITNTAKARESIVEFGKRKTYGLYYKAKALFEDIASKAIDIYKKYPKLLVVTAALGTLTAVVTSYLLIRSEDPDVEAGEGPSCAWQDEDDQPLDKHAEKIIQRKIRAEQQNYENTQAKKGVKLVKAEHQAYGDKPHAKKGVKLVKAEGNEDQNSTDIRKVVHPNLVVVGWMKGSSKRTTLRGLHIGGQLLLLPFHFFNGATEGDRFILAHRLNPIYVDFEKDKLARLDDKDWCLYDCGPRFEPRKNISKYFIKEAHLGKLTSLNAMLCNIDLNGVYVVQKGLARAILNFKYTDAATKDKYIQRGWETNFATEAGDCGSFLMAMTPAIPAPGKILGIHTAGYVKRSQGFSVLITYEQLQQAIAKLPQQVYGLPVPKEVDRDESVTGNIRCAPEGDYSIYGSMPNKLAPAQPVKTDFKKTPFSEESLEGIPCTKKPAHLHPFKNAEGNMVSPLRIALAKYGQGTIPFRSRNVKKVKKHLINMFKNKLVGTERRVFSEKEAIVGIPGLEFADRLNMKSSPGWPYQVLNKKEPGKFYMFDEEGNVVNDELRQRIDERLSNAKLGQRVPSLWRDCMKDELRPVEKVDSGKTRLFTIAPVDYTILVRRYFMDFAINFYGNSCNFFSAVGINPESYEWTKLYNRLAECGNRCVAGDYKAFDGTLMPELMDACADIINAWYDDGEENARVRKVYINEMIHTMQLVENCVYATHQGNPSGNPLTVIINTIVNYMYLCLVFLEVYPEATLDEFEQETRSVCYGDDLLITVRDKFRKFNFNSIRDILTEHGLGFTTDRKSPEQEEPDFVELDSVTFLKRGFRVDVDFGKQFKLPTMAVDTLNSYFHWVRKSEEEEEQLQENMRSALAFAAFHGRDFYDEYHNKWAECMRSANYSPLCITFEEQVDAFLVAANTANLVGADRQFFDNLTEGQQIGEIHSVFGVPIVKPLTPREKFWQWIKLGAYGITAYCVLRAISWMDKQGRKVLALDIKERERNSRWAICIPSGEGKTTLARKYPDYFVDIDDLILFKGEYPTQEAYVEQKLYEKYGVGKDKIQLLPWAKQASCYYDLQIWWVEWIRSEDIDENDRRILLTHAPMNTYRKIAASFLLPEATHIRNNEVGREMLKKMTGVKYCDFDEREKLCLQIVEEKEPAVYAKEAFIAKIERTVGHFTSRVSF